MRHKFPKIAYCQLVYYRKTYSRLEIRIRRISEKIILRKHPEYIKFIFNSFISSDPFIFNLRKIKKKLISLCSEEILFIFGSKHEENIEEVGDNEKNSDKVFMEFEKIGTE